MECFLINILSNLPFRYAPFYGNLAPTDFAPVGSVEAVEKLLL
jgi:hypothetical protein